MADYSKKKSFSFLQRRGVINNSHHHRGYTAGPIPLTYQNCQVDSSYSPISGQSYVRYPLGGGVALAGGSALLTRLLTNMRLIAVN